MLWSITRSRNFLCRVIGRIISRTSCRLVNTLELLLAVEGVVS